MMSSQPTAATGGKSRHSGNLILENAYRQPSDEASLSLATLAAAPIRAGASLIAGVPCLTCPSPQDHVDQAQVSTNADQRPTHMC